MSILICYSCTPVKTSSKLPELKYETKNQLNSFAINGDEIFPIIKNLDVNKAHGCYNMSIRMIRLCGKIIVTPLKLLFLKGTYLVRYLINS